MKYILVFGLSLGLVLFSACALDNNGEYDKEEVQEQETRLEGLNDEDEEEESLSDEDEEEESLSNEGEEEESLSDEDEEEESLSDEDEEEESLSDEDEEEESLSDEDEEEESLSDEDEEEESLSDEDEEDDSYSDEDVEDDVVESLKLTLDELAQYNGKDGNPAYIAVDGVVYDLTHSPQWSSGVHRGQFEAGKDYSEKIREIPRHGTSVLDQLLIVGHIID